MKERYAKENGQELAYPTDEEFAGIVNWRLNDKMLRLAGYKPVVGEPENREGYTAEPATWHAVQDSEETVEQRQVIENGRSVMRPVPVTVDKSYIQIDTWEYTEIEAPDVPSRPVHYSKYKIQLACQKRGLWEQLKAMIDSAGLSDSWNNIIDLTSDNAELAAAMPGIRQTFGTDVVDAVLAESVADYSPLAEQLQ